MPTDLLLQLEREFSTFLLPDSIISDSETQRPFECDGLPVYTEMPLLVVLPETVEQVCRVMEISHRHRVPVVARGAGTGLCGGAVPHSAGILLGLSKLNRIIHIDPDARLAKVQCGVTNLAISQAAEKYGLYYAPDPSSQIACSIGGNVAENSGGVHCLKYGLTIHNIISVDLVTPEGDLVTLGSEGLESAGLDLLALITGSEGLLGVVVAITVKLLAVPEVARVVMAGFDEVTRAADAVGAIIGEGIVPAALEMMDNLAIRAAEDFVNAGYPTDAQALLLCELDGIETEVGEYVSRVERILSQMGATSIRSSRNEAERTLLWKGRKSAFPAVGRISPDYYCMDGTIPRGALGKVLAEIKRLSEYYRLPVANVFHAGDGNLHPLILFDAGKPGELEAAEALGGDILTLCVDVGGCITGEHGVGVEKLRQMPYQFSDEEMRQFHAVKEAFDVAGLLNPGKGIPTLKQCQEYRALEDNQA